MRCTAITNAGNRCKTFALKGEQFCINHSNSEKAKAYRKNRISTKNPLTRAEHIGILEKELRRVRKDPDDKFRSAEIRKIITLIYELRGEKKPLDKEKKSLPLSERIELAEQKSKKEK